MGGFYSNITLMGPSQEQTVRTLQGRRAVVTPTTGSYAVVFDSVCDDQDIDEIRTLAAQLSRDLTCRALTALVHDDDVFVYFFHDNGVILDSYNSCPDYFDFGSAQPASGPAGGDAELLGTAFHSADKNEIERILRRPKGKGSYVFETDRHRDLVRLLGLPAVSVGYALANFERGEYPEGLVEGDMRWTSNAPSQEEDKQRRRDREFYDQLGPEDSLRPCKRAGCGRGAITHSVLCRRHHFEMILRRDCPFNL